MLARKRDGQGTARRAFKSFSLASEVSVIFVVEPSVAVAGQHGVLENVIGYASAESRPVICCGAEVDAAVDASVLDFVQCLVEAREGADDTGHLPGFDGEGCVLTVERGEDGGC